MSWSDPIADMLTRIRNAQQAGHEVVVIPYSRQKASIVSVLKNNGYVKDVVTDGGPKRVLRVYLKYQDGGEPAISGIKRVSTPGLRRYVSVRDLPRVLGGMGVAVLSTSTGIMTDSEARKKRVGGEWICSVW